MTGNWTSKVRCLPFFFECSTPGEVRHGSPGPASSYTRSWGAGPWDLGQEPSCPDPTPRACGGERSQELRPTRWQRGTSRTTPASGTLHPSPVLRPSRAPPDLCPVLSHLTQGTVSGNKRPLARAPSCPKRPGCSLGSQAPGFVPFPSPS